MLPPNISLMIRCSLEFWVITKADAPGASCLAHALSRRPARGRSLGAPCCPARALDLARALEMRPARCPFGRFHKRAYREQDGATTSPSLCGEGLQKLSANAGNSIGPDLWNMGEAGPLASALVALFAKRSNRARSAAGGKRVRFDAAAWAVFLRKQQGNTISEQIRSAQPCSGLCALRMPERDFLSMRVAKPQSFPVPRFTA